MKKKQALGAHDPVATIGLMLFVTSAAGHVPGMLLQAWHMLVVAAVDAGQTALQF